MSEVIRAPFTPEQVTVLNQYQESGAFHPFTCGKRDLHLAGQPDILIATEAGWVCPAQGCDYHQDWAHAAMADPVMVENARQVMVGFQIMHYALETFRERQEE